MRLFVFFSHAFKDPKCSFVKVSYFSFKSFDENITSALGNNKIRICIFCILGTWKRWRIYFLRFLDLQKKFFGVVKKAKNISFRIEVYKQKVLKKNLFYFGESGSIIWRSLSTKNKRYPDMYWNVDKFTINWRKKHWKIEEKLTEKTLKNWRKIDGKKHWKIEQKLTEKITKNWRKKSQKNWRKKPLKNWGKVNGKKITENWRKNYFKNWRKIDEKNSQKIQEKNHNKIQEKLTNKIWKE